MEILKACERCLRHVAVILAWLRANILQSPRAYSPCFLVVAFDFDEVMRRGGRKVGKLD